MKLYVAQLVAEPPRDFSEGERVEVLVRGTVRVRGDEAILEPREVAVVGVDPATESAPPSGAPR